MASLLSIASTKNPWRIPQAQAKPGQLVPDAEDPAPEEAAAIDPAAVIGAQTQPSYPHFSTGPSLLGMASAPYAPNDLNIGSTQPENPDDPNKKGAFKKSGFEIANHVVDKTAENRLLSPEQVQAGAAAIRGLPEVQDQQAGEKNLQNSLSMLMGQKNADPGWVKPLLALSDSQTGSKLMEGYTPGLSSSDKAQLMLKYSDEMQKRKNDVAKTLIQGLSAQKNGSVLTNTVDNLSKQMGDQGYKNPSSDPQQMMVDRQAYMAHRVNMQDVKKDIPLNDMFGRYRVVNDAISNLTNASNLTPQQFHEAQQAIRTAIFPKGVSSGVDERTQNYIHNAGFSVDDLIQTITGDPAKILQSEPDIRHIEELAKNMKQNFAEGARRRISMATGGNDWIYDDPKYAHLLKSMQHEIELAQDQFTPTPNAQAGLNMRGAPGSHMKGIPQDRIDAFVQASGGKINSDQAKLILMKRDALKKGK